MDNSSTSTIATRDIIDLVILSALWGASFLFLRIAAPEFGPVFLIEMRVLTAFVFLLPVFLYLGKLGEAIRHWKIIFVLSLANMALPFCLLAFAALSVGAGVISILNATVPFFTALIAFFFYQQKMFLAAIVGLVLGFSGVVLLLLDPDSVAPVATNALAYIAGLAAAALYGTAANITSSRMRGISGLAITVGSLFFASLYLLPFALWSRPASMPTGWIWLSVIGLGVLCTGVAYVIFYRLIGRIGSSRAVTVTFLVPLFSILWGNLFLGEAVTVFMGFGCILVLLGVGLTTGKLPTLGLFRSRASSNKAEP